MGVYILKQIKDKKYKIIISTVFGLLGFFANFFSIKIINLSEIGFNVHLLWGLIFPLLITLAWGWKYGLIAALSGGCQTMWWLWFADGYGVLYSVPVFSLWIIWHGFWADYRRDKSKWYYNKYLMEIPFRIISAAGFYTVFRYLVSLNPPPWAFYIKNNYIQLSWVNSVVLKHIVSAYLLILIVDIMLNMNIVRKFFKLEDKYVEDNSLIIYVFVSVGLVYWLIDTIIDYFFYYNSSFFDLLFLKVPGHELFMRVVVFVISTICGLIIHKIISEKDKVEQKYKILFNNLEDAIFLSEYNKQLKEEKIIEVNDEAANLLNYNRQDLLNLQKSDIHNDKGKNDFLLSNNKQSIKYESVLIGKDKKEIIVEVKSRLFKLYDKEVVLSIARDITEKKERIKKLQEQKEELQAANQQLKAYSEEITAKNEELDDSVKQVNELNKRFVNMIKVVSSLDKSSRYDEQSFLSNLLHSAINIVPEADYGKICIVEEDDKCKFIDVVGHDSKLLQENKISKKIFFHHGEKDIYTSDEYSMDIKKIPANIQKTFISSLKPISKSIYINIVVNNEVLGRISLDIAEESNKEFLETTKHVLESFATLASSFFSFQRFNKLQENFTKELITAIIKILEMYDRYTSGHSENVAQIASNIAEEMGVSQQKIKDTYWAGMVHDIGKLLVPLHILNKKEVLTDDEYKIIKMHPQWGYEALSKSEPLKHIAKYVLHHHERWDGDGYPKGLKGEEIPLISQILVVADAWDAMTSKRAYRNPLSEKKALEEIEENMGKQFSPKIVKAFLKTRNIKDRI